MAFTQSDVDAIKKAIASGTDSVTFADGRRVQYRTIADLKQALALAQSEVTQSTAGSATVSYASFCKG